MYAPHLSQALNTANVAVLGPMLAWTVAQYLIWYRHPELPDWLSAVNPIVDVTAVTAIIGGYALAQSGVLALRSPIFLMYFVVLAGRPVASSVRKAALISVLAFAEYAVLLAWLWATNRVPIVINPIDAVQLARITPLDEAAKLILLGVFGTVSTYATSWVEHLVREASKESAERQRVVTRLVQSELDTLKLQLNPHFLFNALNSAMALIATDPPAAERMVSELSDFLRLVLSTSSEQEVPLERELGLLDRYVAIQRVRFQDRLTVSCNIEDGVRAALVRVCYCSHWSRTPSGTASARGRARVTFRSPPDDLETSFRSLFSTMASVCGPADLASARAEQDSASRTPSPG
jgi:hypothetical protein